MKDKIKGVLVAMAACGALAIGGTAIAGAAGNNDQTAPPSSAPEATSESENDSDRNETDVAIKGTDLDRASAAALEYAGGGQVTGTEVNDEESYYEVEVSDSDGSQVDVQLDRDFTVVSSEADGQDG